MAVIRKNMSLFFALISQLIRAIIEGKLIENEYERLQVTLLKNRNKHLLLFGEEWPHDFEEEWG